MKNMKKISGVRNGSMYGDGSMTACGSGKSDSGSSDAATTDSSSSDSSGDNGEVKLTMLGREIYRDQWAFHHHSRDEYKELIEKHGGKNVGSISLQDQLYSGR